MKRSDDWRCAGCPNDVRFGKSPAMIGAFAMMAERETRQAAIETFAPAGR